MKNRLCLLLWKVNNINKNDFSENNFYSIVQKLIDISKEEIIGRTLNILLKKLYRDLNDSEKQSFNEELFKDLKKKIFESSQLLENSYKRMNLANEYLRAIEENDKKSFKDNENYLSSNTYLVISKYFNQKDSINQTLNPKIPKIQEFLEKIYNMEDVDNKLKTYYKQTIDSIELDYEKENNKNPKQVNEIINFLNSFNISSQEEYKKIIADFISSRIYDNIISHKPDVQDKKIFNSLINQKYQILMNNETNIEQKIFNNMIMSMKKYIHFKGVYQKAKAIKELYLYNQYYSSFSKGKQGENKYSR